MSFQVFYQERLKNSIFNGDFNFKTIINQLDFGEIRGYLV